jgi:phosphate transport system protein
MSSHSQMIDRREGSVRNLIGELFDATENALGSAIQCLENRDFTLAQSIIDSDRDINQQQREIENTCVTVIARMQPMARDLRELVSDIQIAAELERIADYACSIAATVMKMKEAPEYEVAEAITMLGTSCRRILSSVRRAYDNRNAEEARQAAEMDNIIDSGEKEIIQQVFNWQSRSPGEFETATYALWVTQTLERIGDRATNIAERVVYIATSHSEDLN